MPSNQDEQVSNADIISSDPSTQDATPRSIASPSTQTGTRNSAEETPAPSMAASNGPNQIQDFHGPPNIPPRSMERENAAIAAPVGHGDGPEIIPDNVGPPVAGASYDNKCDTSKKEIVVPSSDDDDDGPPNPFGIEEELFGNLKTASLPGYDEDDAALTPFDSSEFEDNVTKKMKEHVMVPNEEESIAETGEDDLDAGEDPPPIMDTDEESPPIVNEINNAADSTEESPTSLTSPRNSESDTARPSMNSSSSLGGSLRDLLRIPVAYLVESSASEDEDEEVFIATPTIPLHRQKRVRLLGVFVCTVLLVLVVSLGISLTRDVETQTSAPSSSFAPTMPPTTAFPTSDPSESPSSSGAPSSPPSECSEKIVTNTKEIDLILENPIYSQVAVDRNDMVVVSKDFTSSNYIEFFKLSDGKWESVNFVVDGGGSDVEPFSPFDTVTISGITALVSLIKSDDDGINIYHGIVHVYEKNRLGYWEEMNPLMPNDGNLWAPVSLDIDGDLACVGTLDKELSGIENAQGGSYIFHRKDEWVQVEKMTLGCVGAVCHVSGNTISVMCHKEDSQVQNIHLYHYDGNIDSVVPLQEPLAIGVEEDIDRVAYVNAHVLSQDHLVYLLISCDYSLDYDCGEGLFIYERNFTTQEFNFLQRLDAVYIDYNQFSGAVVGMALDEDILLMSGSEETNIFSKQEDGLWRIALRLDVSYQKIHMSGREVVGASWYDDASEYHIFPDPVGLHSFSVEDCIITESNASPCELIAEFNQVLFESDCDGCIPALSIDGDTAVVMRARENGWLTYSELVGEIHFFSVTDQRIQTLNRFNLRSNKPSLHDVAISGNKAAFGVSYGMWDSGVVHLFTENSVTEKWDDKKVVIVSNKNACLGLQPNELAFDQNRCYYRLVDIDDAHIGRSVDIDGELLAVGANRTVHIFREENSAWQHEAALAVPDNLCSPSFGRYLAVRGKIVAVADDLYGMEKRGAVFVYIHDSASKTWRHTQRIFAGDECGGSFGDNLVLMESGGLLVGCPGYANFTGAVYYYTTSGSDNTYMLQQIITASDRVAGAIFSRISESNGTLAIGSFGRPVGKVYIFSLGTNWTEESTIDAPVDTKLFGSQVALSGDKLLVSSIDNVFSYTVICSSRKAQLSNLQRLAPTFSPQPSQSGTPSNLAIPSHTACEGYEVEISIVYDEYPYRRMSWDLSRGGRGILASYKAAYGEAPYIQKVCLEHDGNFKFEIFDWDGIDYGVRYNITSNGQMIAQGGEFAFSESSEFQLASTMSPTMSHMPSGSLNPSHAPSLTSSPSLVPSVTPSQSPSLSSSPSLVPSTSQSPSRSSSPTETCYWITVAIIYDDWPYETSWDIKKNDNIFESEVIVSHSAEYGDTSLAKSVCLPMGEYEYTIYDSYGNGILLPGYYNVTSGDNVLIAEGGGFLTRFTFNETTSFAIP